MSTMKFRKKVRQSKEVLPAKRSKIYAQNHQWLTLRYKPKNDAHRYKVQSEVVNLRLKESEVVEGIMRGVSFAANSVWNVFEGRHTRLWGYQHNDAHICSQNLRMIIIIAKIHMMCVNSGGKRVETRRTHVRRDL
jgi:hypothetical protein